MSSPTGHKKRSKIERHVEEDTGHAQTIVYSEDGSCIAFGESSVSSLLGSEETKAKKLIDSLTDLELQGLVHEFNQRLLRTAEDYGALQRELERFAELYDLAFFGLDENSTEKELDQAYRKMAKRIHPDKNGNTEEAKARFQDMKERYERLKKKFQRQESLTPPKFRSVQDLIDKELVPPTTPIAGQPEELPAAEDVELPRVEESTAPLLGEPTGGNDAKQEEPVDREKLDAAIWRVLRRTKLLIEKVDFANQQIGRSKEVLESLRREGRNSTQR